MTSLMDIPIAALIASVFLAPAVLRPTLGRVLLSMLFIGGALFNLLYTLPNAPGSLVTLVATAPIPPYKEVIATAIAWNATAALAVAVVVFEFAVGLLILWRGRSARVAMLAAGAWGIGMLPVIPPEGLLIGIATTGAPGVAGLLLARHKYRESLFTAGWRSRVPHFIWSALRGLVQPIPALLIFGALWALFILVIHPWFMNWGSTPDEQAMTLPGDSQPPSAYFTRAITIDAPPSAVWPWLLAIGQDRAGFLSNDYLENLTGADIHNADALRPDWTQRAIGDKVPMGSPGQRAAIGEATTTTIRILEPERVIADTPGRFVLMPSGDSGTRLLLRESLEDPLRSGALWVLWDPMHFVMEQRMLQGIKERAEGQPLVPPLVLGAAHIGWAIAGLGLTALFAVQRGWRLWLLLPMGLMLPPLWWTGDMSSFMAGYLALGISLAGFLAFGWRWVAPYLLVASFVALVLLLAPDSYAAFGLIFLAIAASIAGAFRDSARELLTSGAGRPASPRAAAA
jgi:hypothetical protein